MKDKNRVVFIGDKVERQLFGNMPAVGRHLYINDLEFTVIGVTKPGIYNWLKNRVMMDCNYNILNRVLLLNKIIEVMNTNDTVSSSKTSDGIFDHLVEGSP